MTRKSPRTFVLVCGVLLLMLATADHPARARIVLSSDANIPNALDGSSNIQIVDPGNRRFFSNVLGSGHTVKVDTDGDPIGGDFLPSVYNAINNYYNAQSGVSSSLYSGTITPGTFAGVDLFFEILPGNDLSSTELSAMADFVNTGGQLFFMGDNANFPNSNSRINAALAYLGAGMSILNQPINTSVATVTPPLINTADPLMAGVTTFTYASTSTIAPGSNTVLLRRTDNAPVITVVPEPAGTTLALIALAPLLARRRTQKK